MYYYKDNITLYYEKHGEHKRSIIILPGWGDTRKTFTQLINFLENYFTVFIIDYPGFGNTPFPEKDLTIYDYSMVIYDLIQELNIDNPILIGHSFGGRIISVLTGYYGFSFSNIILMNSAGIKPKKTFYKRCRSFFYKVLKNISTVLPKNIKEKWKNFLFKRFASTDYQNLTENMRNTFKNVINEDLTPYFKNIKANTLIIWGKNDKSTPIKDGYKINKLINNSEIIVLDGSGHFTYLDYPILINRIIFEQLKDEIK